MKQKRCIFHIPNYINSSIASGSSLRPMKMLEAFRANGYDVDYIMGYGKERKNGIKEIKEKIKNGVEYDFIYSESSTMPTMLTEKNHLPRYPFLDFRFFRFCKKKDIPIGLFYRDIQWKFDFYKKEVPFYKRCVSIPLYYYDLKKYRFLLDKLYLPSNDMKKWMGNNKALLEKQDVLMPGGDKLDLECCKKKEKRNFSCLNLFYVGGIRNIYDLEDYLKAISKCEFVNAIICCRENEWELEKERYGKYLNDKIKIIHATGSELKPYYEWADICAVFIGDEEYARMAMSIKVFEYLAHGCPVIATKGTVPGAFVKQKGVGWSVESDYQSLQTCLEWLHENPQEIVEKIEKIISIQKEHTWEARAKQVIEDMKSVKRRKK